MRILEKQIKMKDMSDRTSEAVTDLPGWLQGELNLRNWTAADLAERAGVYHSTISRILKGERKAGADACRAIAVALGEEPDKVFRLAGLLPEEKKGPGKLSEFQEELLRWTDELDEASQRMVLEIVKGLVSRSRR